MVERGSARKASTSRWGREGGGRRRGPRVSGDARATAEEEDAYAEEEEADALLREIFEEGGVEHGWRSVKTRTWRYGGGERYQRYSERGCVRSADTARRRATAREAAAAGAVAVVSSEPIDGLADVPVVIVENVDEALAAIMRCFTAIPPRR